ncbi:MAG: alpha/beta hydrolase-fold protein [Micrococcus sp.]|nr:alpha/beta hydrolase-fold protein [Micrococcus sp.]
MGEWLDAALRAVGDVPLLQDWMVPASVAVGVAAAVGLWLRTRRRSARVQVMVLTVPVVMALAAYGLVNGVWRPVAEGIGAGVFAWLALILLLILQAAVGPWRPRPARWALRAAASLAAGVLAMALGLNAHYGTYQSIAMITGTSVTWTPWQDVDTAPRASLPIASWQATAHTADPLPDAGQLTTVAIPSSDPQFSPRDAVVYLPPAYQLTPRPQLPVMVLMAGVPGSPQDWAIPGTLAATMDAFAAEHAGLAPIVVVPDPLGSTLADPLCSDGSQGRVATYLTDDVPAWAEATLQAEPDRSHWVIGGISNGATCALQTVARTPEAYGGVLVMSGELHPSLGSEEQTIAEGFGGDRSRYEANDPLSLFARALQGEGPGAGGAYGKVQGIVSAGRGDTYVGMPIPQELVDAGTAAGMGLQLRLYPGGHQWAVWSHALRDQLPWAAQRMGLTG